jgi:hypothetical protein
MVTDVVGQEFAFYNPQKIWFANFASTFKIPPHSEWKYRCFLPPNSLSASMHHSDRVWRFQATAKNVQYASIDDIRSALAADAPQQCGGFH